MQSHAHVPGDASLSRRATARAIDALGVLAIATFLIAAVLPDRSTTGHALDALRIGGPWTLTRTIANGIVVAVAISLHTILESRTGRTLGKALVGLQVIGPDGYRPTVRQAFARNAWLLLPLIPWLGTLTLGLVVFLIAIALATSRTTTGWHDELAGTAVVRSVPPTQ